MNTIDWLIKNSDSKIRLDCDFGSSGLWTSKGQNIGFTSELLPHEIMMRITKWQKDYDNTLLPITAPNYGEASKSWWDSHFAERNAIAIELQQFLGGEIDVVVWECDMWIKIDEEIGTPA